MFSQIYFSKQLLMKPNSLLTTTSGFPSTLYSLSCLPKVPYHKFRMFLTSVLFIFFMHTHIYTNNQYKRFCLNI